MFTDDEKREWKRKWDELVEEVGGREYYRRCDEERRYPYELYEKIVERGWIGVLVPRELGGLGLPPVMYCLTTEAVAKYGYDVGTAYSMSTFTFMNIVHHGSEEQRRKYIPRFLRGEVRFSFSLTEPEAGSDAASITTFAEDRGNCFEIKGHKIFASGAGAKNNIIVLAARTNPDAPKHKGISLFLLPNDTEGLELRLLPTVARRATGTYEILLNNVRLPKENLIGERDKGWDYILEHLDLERVSIASALVGCAQTAVLDACEYARRRVQFGRPVGKFQAISHMLANMQTEVDAARLLAYRGAYILEEKGRAPKECAMAKLFASEVFQRVTTSGMQIMGGYSLLPENNMERYWREAKALTIGGGTSEIMRLIISREMGL